MCQVIYPCDKSKPGQKQFAPSEYTRNYVREAMGSRFFGSPYIAHLALMRRGHPCGHEGYPPEEGKWPVIIFSHGLFGNGDFYCDIAIHLASLGCVVVVVEHGDGSALGACKVTGESIPYMSPFSSGDGSNKQPEGGSTNYQQYEVCFCFF